jgi:hypothetical protein
MKLHSITRQSIASISGSYPTDPFWRRMKPNHTLALAGAALMLTACGSSGPGAARVTDSAVARSGIASKFVSDLYKSSNGHYWQSRDEAVLVDIAGAYCVQFLANGASTIDEDFDGLPKGGLDEFKSIAKRDVCGAMNKTGGTIPGYDD